MQRTARHPLAPRPVRHRPTRPKTSRLSVETLDDRTLPSAFTVTTNANDGPGSLRQAILDSNANPGPDTIGFNIGGGGVQTIQPTAALPEITDAVVIDGTTQPGFAGSLLVVLTGTAFDGGANGYGLWITAGSSTVRGLVVNGFAGADIRIEAGGNNLIAGNYLGTDDTGTAAVRNPFTAGVGVLVGSANNTVGGTTAADRNLISGHAAAGVSVSGPGATGNQILGNFVGTTVDGTARLGNANGVVVDGGASANVIGGAVPGAGNLLSGNNNVGLGLIAGTGNLVQGNRIGTDATGAVSLRNLTGVFVQGGVGHLIGGAEPGAGNLISGNVGPNASFGYGLIITNDGATGAVARDHQVLGNYVGTNAAGTAAVPNTNDGIRVDFGSLNVTVGGTSPAARNVVSGNGQVGIFITSGRNNVVQGNYVGTNAAGTAALPNGDSGVIVGGTGNTVGGTAPGAGNLVSGNRLFGVGVSGVFNLVQGNFIGTDVTGTAALGNGFAGVGAQGNLHTIGGTAPGAGNIISGNGGYAGVRLTGGQAIRVQGNFIGTDVTGTRALGNGKFGVAVDSGLNHLIGGAAPGARNIISANGTGVAVITNQIIVQGNLIGTDVTGTAPLGNGVGVFLTFSNKTIGGTAPGEGNTIAFNTGVGVLVDPVEGFSGHRIRGNSIHSNGGLGIDLRGDGVTANDPGDADTGPNQLQNFPVLSVALAGASTRVSGNLNSAANATFNLDFYASAAADPSGFGEGARYLGSAIVNTDASGNVSFQVTLAAATTPGEVVTATATDLAGNTSEFSAAVLAYKEVAIDIKPGDAANNVNLNSNGVLPVAVLTTPDFDATTVDLSDLSRIRFGDVNGTARVSPVRAAFEDVDHDGDLDLVLFFSTRAIRESGALTVASTQAELTGFTTGGVPFRGVDGVSIVMGDPDEP
jgi:parallel beta-helix repeat protein